jgi:hypothetical protein
MGPVILPLRPFIPDIFPLGRIYELISLLFTFCDRYFCRILLSQRVLDLWSNFVCRHLYALCSQALFIITICSDRLQGAQDNVTVNRFFWHNFGQLIHGLLTILKSTVLMMHSPTISKPEA